MGDLKPDSHLVRRPILPGGFAERVSVGRLQILHLVFDFRGKSRRSRVRDLSDRGSVLGGIRGECRPNATEGFHGFCGRAAKQSHAITRVRSGIGQVRSFFRIQIAYET